MSTTIQSQNSAEHAKIVYRHLLDDLQFIPGKPNMENVSDVGPTHFKKVTLKEGTELNCHRNQAHAMVVWLFGKAKFTAGGIEYSMHPGSSLEMPVGTPHGAIAETDCVFLVIKTEVS